ncbi:unnamed protein product [Rhizophagus irregularis]|nr:unnamed protein product [Rhizophagus irregularis]
MNVVVIINYQFSSVEYTKPQSLQSPGTAAPITTITTIITVTNSPPPQSPQSSPLQLPPPQSPQPSQSQLPAYNILKSKLIAV